MRVTKEMEVKGRRKRTEKEVVIQSDTRVAGMYKNYVDDRVNPLMDIIYNT